MAEQLVETLRASAAQTTGTVTGTEANGGAIKWEESYQEAVFTLDVTALATDAGDHLDVYVDISFDGGASWVNAIHFTQLDGTGSASKELAILKLNPAVEDMYAVTSDLAESTSRQIGLGTMVRYRGVVTNTSTDDASFTYSLSVFAKE